VGGVGRRGGATTNGGGSAKRDGPATPGGDAGNGCGPGADATFTPGQNGTLTWNTTQAIDRRPILLYVFDGHTTTGADYDFSRLLEQQFLKDKDVVEASDDFVCEKLCLKEADFLLTTLGREPVQKWLAANMNAPAQRKAELVLLDANGTLVRTLDMKDLRTAKPTLVVRELKKAQKTNAERLAAAAPPPPKKV
jgi:hypothetical protein